MARKGEPADSPKGEQPVVTEDQVVAYLKANPDGPAHPFRRRIGG